MEELQNCFLKWLCYFTFPPAMFEGFNYFTSWPTQYFPSFFFFWLYQVACRILVPSPGMEPMPPSMQWKWGILTTELPGKLLHLFYYRYPSRCIVKSHCGFDLCFPNNKCCWASFHVLAGCSHVFFGEMSIEVLCSCLNWRLLIFSLLES